MGILVVMENQLFFCLHHHKSSLPSGFLDFLSVCEMRLTDNSSYHPALISPGLAAQALFLALVVQCLTQRGSELI